MKTLLIWMSLAAAAVTFAAAPTPQPNMVLIIADDLAWDDVGAFGHPTIKTPHIDRLAREGMLFERAFVTASSCSPSRSSLITGRYPHGTDAEQLHWPLPAEQVTFVEHLRAAGYWTAVAGKWHLGPAVRDRFDEIREADPAGYMLAAGAKAGATKMSMAQSGDIQSGCADWVPLLRARPRERPFFVWLAALDPHRDYEENIAPQPTKPAEVVVPRHLPDTPGVRRELALYHDEVERLDRFVGAVLAELAAQGVADNTLVVFLSDNGRPFPRDKTTVFEGGIRTPLIVRWPGHARAGTRCAQLVSTVDFAPGFLAAAGLKPPASIQGVSFLPLLAEPGRPVRSEIFAEQNWHDYEQRTRAVRTVDFKLVVHDYPDLPLTPGADVVRGIEYREMQRLRELGQLTPEQQQCFLAPRASRELYDLRSDPVEFHNVAGDPAYAGVLADLAARLEAWKKATNDVAPTRRTADEFDRTTGNPLPNRKRPRASKAEMLGR
ncbi:MAG: sulfatase [Opitutaceae bacterium]|nr:sulfatase [Opitutaceae bacterium]